MSNESMKILSEFTSKVKCSECVMYDYCSNRFTGSMCSDIFDAIRNYKNKK